MKLTKEEQEARKKKYLKKQQSKLQELLSNCCGASSKGGEDYEICSECGEHCEYNDDEENEYPGIPLYKLQKLEDKNGREWIYIRNMEGNFITAYNINPYQTEEQIMVKAKEYLKKIKKHKQDDSGNFIIKEWEIDTF